MILKFVEELKSQLIDDINKTSERLNYFQSIVNAEITPEYLDQKERQLASQTKFLQAYATLVTRIKQRTDEFVKTNSSTLCD